MILPIPTEKWWKTSEYFKAEDLSLPHMGDSYDIYIKIPLCETLYYLTKPDMLLSMTL